MAFMSRWVYDEVKYPIKDYWKNLNLQEFLFDVGLPALMTCAIYCLLVRSISRAEMREFIGSILTVVSILMGFSIAAVTILASADGANIQELRKADSSRKAGSKRMKLFQVLTMYFVYGLIAELLTLGASIIYYLLYVSNESLPGAHLLFALILLLLFHVLLVIIRSVTSFYFVLLKDG